MIVRKVVCPLFLVVETVLYFILALIKTILKEKPNKRILTLSLCRIENMILLKKGFHASTGSA